MIKKNILLLTSILLCLLFTQTAFSWKHNISLGYGRSKEEGYDYHQQGIMLDLQTFPFKKIDKTLLFGVGASLADWRASSNQNKRMLTTAVAALFRAYFTPPENSTHKFKPYLAASFGPAYLLSNRKLGEREQGSRLIFQTTLGIGSEVEFKESCLDFSLKFAHYCNGGIFKPNQGIDIWYIFSIGYLFG